jgi:hypothetical protein
MKKVFSAILAVSFLAVGSIAYAQSATDLNGIKISGTGFVTFFGVDQKAGKLATKGSEISVETEGNSKDQVNYRVELFFDKAFSDGSSARLRLRGGASDENLALGTFRGGVDDAQTSLFKEAIWIKELFYTKPFTGLPFVGNSSIVVGKTGAPTSSNSGAASIGSFFTDDATVQGAPGADQNPYGIKININPVSLVSITYAYMTQNHGGSEHNITEGAYNFIEANFKPIARGNYRVGFWYSATRFEKNAWVVREDATEDEKGTPLEYLHDNSETDFPNGILVSVDQVVVDNVTLFARYGKRLDETRNASRGATDINWNYKAPDSNTGASATGSIFNTPGNAGQDFQIGAKIGGAFWGRAKDYLFVAYGMAWYQDKVISYDNNVITGVDKDGKYETAELKPETHIELNYNYNINEAVNIIAFGQYALDYALSVATKTGNDRFWKVDESGYALGLRIAINF